MLQYFGNQIILCDSCAASLLCLLNATRRCAKRFSCFIQTDCSPKKFVISYVDSPTACMLVDCDCFVVNDELLSFSIVIPHICYHFACNVFVKMCFVQFQLLLMISYVVDKIKMFVVGKSVIMLSCSMLLNKLCQCIKRT